MLAFVVRLRVVEARGRVVQSRVSRVVDHHHEVVDGGGQSEVGVVVVEAVHARR